MSNAGVHLRVSMGIGRRLEFYNALFTSTVKRQSLEKDISICLKHSLWSSRPSLPLPPRHLPQIPAQDLAARRLRNHIQPRNASPQLFVVRGVLLNVVLDGGLVDLGPVSDDVGTREFIARAVGVRDADDGCVGDERVREEEGFKFRRRDLQAFVFDKFLR